MIKFSSILSKLILIFLLLGLSLAIFKPAFAQPDYIKIDYPKSGDPSLAGTITVGGTVVTQVSWIGLYLFDSTGPPTLTNAICSLTTFPSYQCTWDTNQVTNGPHLIKTGINISGVYYYSPGVSVTVSNGVFILPITPTPTASTKNTPTPTPTPTPSMTTTTEPIVGRPDLSPIPVAVPISTPPPTLGPTVQEIIASSQVLTTIEYQLDSEKPLHLSKIEERQTSSAKKFLALSGKSYPESYLKITINSQPLVMTAKSDSTGNWQYVLDKPLEPGEHQTFIEVNNNGQIEQSGPYPFAIARAQATNDNPLGASLTLVDPQKEVLKNYLYLAGGVVVLAVLVMLIILYFRKLRKMRTTNPPIKEPSAL